MPQQETWNMLARLTPSMQDEFKRLLADLNARLPASAKTPTWGDLVGALYVEANRQPERAERLTSALDEYFEIKRADQTAG